MMIYKEIGTKENQGTRTNFRKSYHVLIFTLVSLIFARSHLSNQE